MQKVTWFLDILVAPRRTQMPSHAVQCLGLALCGVALAVAVLPAAGQTATAVLSRVLLGRRLSRLQLAAVCPTTSPRS